MPFIPGSDTSFQTQFTNFPSRALPGQLYNIHEVDLYCNSYPVDRDAYVFAGRMVVQAVAQSLDNKSLPIQVPYSIKLPGADEVATLFVGVCQRVFGTMVNIVDTADIANSQPEKAGVQELAMASIMELGVGRRIWVRQAPSLGNVVAGDPVYVATNATNAVNILVGEFAKAAGAGLTLLPNAKWVFSQSTTTGLDQANLITLG